MERKESNCYYEEDEIDLRELFRTIWTHRWFIAIFTGIVTLVAVIYAFLKTPVYEIQSSLQIGYLHNSNNYIINPYALKIYIDSNFGKKVRKELPYIDTSFEKRANSILNLTIYAYSNDDGIRYLTNTLKDINQLEDKRLLPYIQNIKYKIKIYQNQLVLIDKDIKRLAKILDTQKDPQIYQILLKAIKDDQKQSINLKLNIMALKAQLSPQSITKTKNIGKIITNDHPAKPKKKLIIVVAFVTGLILSVFLVFFIEFIKSFKEEDDAKQG